MTLHPDVARLAEFLKKIEDLVETESGDHWAAHVRRCRAAVERSDAWGAYRFLSMFGGMGSINDVGTQRALRIALSEAYNLARALIREDRQSDSTSTSAFLKISTGA
ncbi:MAG: hypothetical protein E6Q98_18345 [Rhodospirillaceae bacterium]|nr:MAG: hypothetical protein E6Q98_18345 [Rhodospirillaceae bacterium]